MNILISLISLKGAHVPEIYFEENCLKCLLLMNFSNRKCYAIWNFAFKSV